MAQRRPAARRRNLQAIRNVYPYTRCHVLRHTFEAVGAIPGITLRPRYGALVTWRCDHCGTIRLDVIGRLSGDLHYRQYIWPDDYKTEYRTMAEWRVLLLAELPADLLVDMGEAQ